MADIKIIYEDNHLLVVVKPPNILSQQDNTGDDDMLTLLKEDIKARYNKPGNVFLGLVHRLDRPVGGAMVFARTSKAASRLSEQIREGELGKTYLAVVKGSLAQKRGRLENYLVKEERTNTVRVCGPEVKGAKYALLEYETEGTAGGFSLVKIRLHTGRSHQIRVQFSAVGHPLLGDRKYGEREGRETEREGDPLALWSAGLEFLHPTTKERLAFRCDPPDTYPWRMFHS